MELRSGKTMAGDKETPQTSTDTEGIQQTIETHTQGDTTLTPTNTNMLQQIMSMMGGINAKLEQNNAKLEETNATIGEKIEENNRKMEENNRKMEENINRNLDEKIDGINRTFENTIKKLEESNIETREKVNNLETTVHEIATGLLTVASETKRQAREEVENLIVDGFTEVDKRLKEQDSKIDMNTRMLRMESLTQAPTYTNKTPLHFFGDNRIHPKVFITRLKQHLQTLHIQTDVKPVVQELMKGNAEFWFELIVDGFETIDEFESLFLKQYWSEHTQQKIRFNLFNGKYNDNLGISRENYVMRKFYNIKYLEPKFTEGEMVRYIARHFKDDIHSVIITQRIDTIDMLVDYLRNIDDHYSGWKNVRRENNRENYRENQQNSRWARPAPRYDNQADRRDRRDYREQNYRPNEPQQRNYNNGGNNNVNFDRGEQSRTQQGSKNVHTTQDRDNKGGKTYAQVANMNTRRDKDRTAEQTDFDRIQTEAQIHKGPSNSDF